MARKLNLQIGSATTTWELPTELENIRSRNFWLWLVNFLTDCATYIYLLSFTFSHVLFPDVGGVALVHLYFLAVLVCINLAAKFLTEKKAELVEVPLLMPTLLFVIVNMTVLLLANRTAALQGTTPYMDSGLTLMALIVFFYQLALMSRHAQKLRNIMRSLLIGIVICLVLSFVAYSSLFVVAPLLLVFVPIFLSYGVKEFKSLNRWIFGVGSLFAVIFAVYHWQTSRAHLQFLLAAIIWLVAVSLLMWRNKISILAEAKIFSLKVRSNPRQLVQYAGSHWQVVAWLIGLVMLIIFVIGVIAAKTDLGTQVGNLVQVYALSARQMVSDWRTLFVGGVGPSLNSLPPFGVTLLSSGLIALLSFLILIGISIRHSVLSLVHNQRRNLILLVILLGFPLWAMIYNLPVSIYLLWWVCWGMLSSQVKKS